MTSNQLTRERLEKIKSWREIYGAGSNVMLPAEEAEELARIALAAMDSEPVAVVEPSDYVTAAQLVGEGPARKAVHELYEGALRIGDKLYRHAQPALVPDKMTYQDGVLFVLNNDMSSIERGTVAMRAWNACRAAMLQAGNSPVIPEGYVMVPKEPTERMVIDGFESEPDETFSEPEVWEAFQKMSGCEQAAFRARLCWAAMLAAAPQEVKGE